MWTTYLRSRGQFCSVTLFNLFQIYCAGKNAVEVEETNAIKEPLRQFYMDWKFIKSDSNYVVILYKQMSNIRNLNRKLSLSSFKVKMKPTYQLEIDSKKWKVRLDNVKSHYKLVYIFKSISFLSLIVFFCFLYIYASWMCLCMYLRTTSSTYLTKTLYSCWCLDF